MEFEAHFLDLRYSVERNEWDGDAGQVLERMLEDKLDNAKIQEIGEKAGVPLKFGKDILFDTRGPHLAVDGKVITDGFGKQIRSLKDILVYQFEEAGQDLHEALSDLDAEFTEAAEEWIQDNRDPYIYIEHQDLNAFNDLKYRISGSMDLNSEEGFLTVSEYTTRKGWQYVEDFNNLSEAKEAVVDRINEEHIEVSHDTFSRTQHYHYVISNHFSNERNIIDDYAETTISLQDENPFSDEYFYQSHFEGVDNLLVNVITTDRAFIGHISRGIVSGPESGNMKVIEEAQSDWDQQIVSHGGRFRDSLLYDQARLERVTLGDKFQKSVSSYQDLIVSGDFEFKHPISRDPESKKAITTWKDFYYSEPAQVVAMGRGYPRGDRGIRKPRGDAEKHGARSEYNIREFLEKSLRTLAHVDALREVFTDKGYNKLLKNAQNYKNYLAAIFKSRAESVGADAEINNFNPAAWEFVGDAPGVIMRDFREYLERTINQDDIREEHQQTYLDAKPSKLQQQRYRGGSQELQQGSGKESKVNLYSFFRRLNYSMIPETIDYLDKSLDTHKYAEAEGFGSILDKHASTVLHSLANFNAAKVLIFNKQRLSHKDYGKSGLTEPVRVKVYKPDPTMRHGHRPKILLL